jgi:hypothetical protein
VSSSAEPTSVTEVAQWDPLQHGIALPLRRMLYPIGFPLEIRANDERVIASAMESWGHSEQRFTTAPLQVRVAVTDGPGIEVPSNPSFRAQEHLLAVVSDACNYAVCDLNAAFAFCWFTPGALRDRAWVRHFFLEAIVYCTLTHLYVTAVHAACIAKNGRGVLLSGQSGSGKSVLSLACARAGWTFVTDDVAYLLRESSNRTVLGKPERMKFLPSAAELFPDLDWGECNADQKDQPFVELRTNEAGISVASESLVDYLVFLRRPAEGQARLVPVRAGDALARLSAELPLFESSVHESHRRSIEMLSRVQPLELAYTDLDDAVRLLDELVGAA